MLDQYNNQHTFILTEKPSNVNGVLLNHHSDQSRKINLNLSDDQHYLIDQSTGDNNLTTKCAYDGIPRGQSLASTVSSTPQSQGDEWEGYEISGVLSGNFSKTRLCVYYLSGHCYHGTQCKYAHSVEEIHRAPDLSKTSLCREYMRLGVCLKNAEGLCRFAHGVSELRSTSNVFKSRICKYWKNGRCVAGSSCRHAHGLDELKPPVENASIGSEDMIKLLIEKLSV